MKTKEKEITNEKRKNIIVRVLTTYKVKLKEESCIRVNIKELNEVSKYNLPTLYIRLIIYTISNLAYFKEYIFALKSIYIIYTGITLLFYYFLQYSL